ncbi:putative ribonuclease H-like domain-containing protein [Tanacetum coccineum]
MSHAKGSGPEWLFDIDLLTNSMNYELVTAGNQTNNNAGIKDNVDVVPTQQYIMLPLLYDSPHSSKDAVADDAGKKTNEEPANKDERNGQEKKGGASNKENDQNMQDFRVELDNLLVQQKEGYANSTNRDSTVSPSVSTAGKTFTNADDLPTHPLIPDLEDTGIFSGAYDDEDVGVEADLNNLETTMNVIQALTDPSWIEAMQEELLQFKLQKVWTLVDLPKVKRAIGTKWVWRNKKDERGIVIRNKARLVAQGYTQEESINYDEVFALVARIEAIRLFLAYASFMGFIVYQMDVKSAFLYGTIEEEMMHKRFQMSSMGELTFFLGLQVMQKDDGIFISQDKYVADILKKFDFVTVKTASTLIETNKALFKIEEAKDMDVYLYRSMIRLLMYLTASRPDIMFAVCACARFQVTPKVSHLHAVKRIFRYLKGQPKLGLWYHRNSPFDLEAFSDSDYAGASLDKKSTTRAEYVATANCCGHVLWIQNQMLDYGFNLMNTNIHIDNESTICIMKNPVFHSKTKHIEIRHHFIRDSYEKKLIQMIKIHTDHNFWATNKSKTVNDVKQIHATVDGKTVVISLSTVRSDLHFNDEDELERMGYENLTQKLTFYKAYFSSQWKFLIHTILQCLSAKTTSWNEFSSTMASAIICLATNQKFNLSKYIFDNMVKNLDGGVKFLMYPRFVQVFLDKQVEGMSKHKGVYVTPSHTKKVFANMKRPCKGFSGRVTPLFSTMMVQATEDMGADSATPTDSHSTPIITQPSSSKPQKKKSRRKQRKDSAPTEPTTEETTPEEHVSTPSYDPPPSGEDRMQLAELMSLCTNLQEKVLDLEKAKTAQAKEITSLKKRVKQLEKRRKSRTSGLRRLRKGRKIEDLDSDAEVTLVNETQEVNDDNLMFDTGVLEEQEIEFEKVVEEPIVSAATTTKSIPVSTAEAVTTASASVVIPDELTLAQTLIEIKTAKPKPVTTAATTVTSVRPRAKGIIFHDQEEQVPASTKTFSSS